MLQYLALYTFGLLKSHLLNPIVQTPHSSPYLDIIANLKFAVNSMSPEEIIPIFHAQIYDVADPNLVDTEFP